MYSHRYKFFHFIQLASHIHLWYHVDAMRTRVDMLPLTLHDCKVSAYNRVWIKLGLGFHCRARATAQGYDIRLRYGANDETKRLPVKVEYGTKRADGVPRPTLVCSACGKFTTKFLYLDTKNWRWTCAKCQGVKGWQIRMPMRWALDEETKFRRLLRRKVDEDILRFEIAALRTLSPEDFLTSRPYLVPPWVEGVRAVNPVLHKKLLRTLHGKYKSVMMKRVIKKMSDKEAEWLMDKLGIVFEKAYIITKKEIAWLKQQKQQTIGVQSGSRLGQLSSQPLEIGCSSQKTSSSLDMSVGPVMGSENSPAQLVGELEHATELEGEK